MKNAGWILIALGAVTTVFAPIGLAVVAAGAALQFWPRRRVAR